MSCPDEELIAILKRAIENNISNHSHDDFDLETDLIDIDLADNGSGATGHNWLNLVHVINDLEIELNIAISDDDIFNYRKVKDIFLGIKNLANSRGNSKSK